MYEAMNLASCPHFRDGKHKSTLIRLTGQQHDSHTVCCGSPKQLVIHITLIQTRSVMYNTALEGWITAENTHTKTNQTTSSHEREP